MDDPRWLRLITIGLVLAALAVGYFLLSGRLSSSNITKQPSPSASVLGQDIKVSPSPAGGLTTIPTAIPTSTPASAYSRIVDRNQSQIQVLPNTGFPVGLAIVFSVSAIISGFGLRKYPK